MPEHPPVRKHFWEILIVVVILLTAFVFRFQHIMSVPSELSLQEAQLGRNALGVLEGGQYGLFYSEDNGGADGLFVNIQAFSLSIFGTESWALRVMPAFAGLLTVLGVYLLARRLFNWYIAALSGFLMAISFWLVSFSRIALPDIFAPLFAVWALYFLWTAKQSGRYSHFALSGIFLGLGLYVRPAMFMIVIITFVVLFAYRMVIMKDFSRRKYNTIKLQIIRGMGLLMLVFIFVASPILLLYYIYPDMLFNDSSSILSSATPVFDFFDNIARVSSSLTPSDNIILLLWPISILFIVGLIRTAFKLSRIFSSHGHLSTVQVLLLSWLFLGSIPAIISPTHSLISSSLLIISPAIFILAGEGLWWIYCFIARWYKYRDPHEVTIHRFHWSEGTLVAAITIAIFLSGLALYSHNLYFHKVHGSSNSYEVFE